MCQGCRHTLRLADSAMPPPPNDLTIARAEICPYHDSSGNLITPHKESAVHHHCHIWCIKAVDPLFVPSSLRIPMEFTISLHPYSGNICEEHLGCSLACIYVAHVSTHVYVINL